MGIWSSGAVLLMSIFLGVGFHIGRCEEKLTFIPNSPKLSWQRAAERCQATGKKLCLRKDICGQGGSSAATRNKLFPRKMIRVPKRDVWVPVSDEHNDWVYIGPKQLRLCKKLSETDGPPSWGGKNCSTNWAEKQNRKIDQFCVAAKGFYCCKNDKTFQNQTPYPVHVYVASRMDNGSPHYSFSLKQSQKELDWFTDKASWRNGGRISGDLRKFTLMSAYVKNQFEDPIFFCVSPFTTPNLLYTKLHKISKKWCAYPWKTNFYLYGSYSEPTSEKYKKYVVGTKKYTEDARISEDENLTFPSKFNIYGPDGGKDRENYVQYASHVKNACGNETEILTSETGVITSPSYPSKYSRKAKSDIACRWKIRSQLGTVVKINFKTMKLSTERKRAFPTLKFRSFQGGRVMSYDFDKRCLVDKVEIAGYGTFCGSQLPPAFVTTDNEVNIKFVGKKGSIGISFALYYEVIAPPNGLTVSRIAKEKLHSFTWTSANVTCNLQGKKLCKASDICSFYSRPFYGVENGDQWAPISDEYNDWIQIGRGNVRTCRRHNQAHGPPLWGILEGTCQGVNMSRPCPKREYLYCCDPPTHPESTASQLVTVLIYSTVQNGVVFFKYLRQNIDNSKKFDSSGIWTPNRKQRGDFTVMKLHTKYAPGIDKVIYFCSSNVIPAIGKLTTAYAMFLQPCETKGWKFLYHLYAMSERQKGALTQYVGIYEKRPYHTRVHFRTFPIGFKSTGGYILYTFGSNNIPPDEDVVSSVDDSACSGGTSTIIAPSVLESPGYPSGYKNDAECRWHIRLPDESQDKGHRMKITIEELSLEDPVDTLSIYEVASTVDVSKSIPDETNMKIFKNRKDFTGSVAQVTITTFDSLHLVFKSDDSIANKGFRIKAEIVSDECGGDVTVNSDVITSPNYPLLYSGGTNCEWHVKAPGDDYNIELTFENFDLVPDKECSDNVRVVSESSGVHLFCGGASPSERIIINERVVNVTFETAPRSSPRSIKGGKGFALRVYFRATNKKKNDSTVAMPQCGIQSVPFDTSADRIVRGFVANKGNFPWMVMIGRPGIACGGSLLSDRWVLTATHCFVSQYFPSLGIMLLHAELRDYVIIAGRYQRNVPSPGEQIFNVSDLAVHGGFERYSSRWRHASGVTVLGVFPYNDIAMVKLSRKAIFSPTVSPVCLPTQDAHVGDFCYVAGWGSKSAHSVNMASPLNYAKVPILDNSLCNSWDEIKGTIKENALCAGYPQGGNDHCWGDSGGPLMCRGRYGNFYINGIVSWSRECGGRRTPGIYTRVWKYVEWVQDVIKTV